MAMVLDAFASYVQNMLTEMVSGEVHMLLGVTDEIEKMDVKLKDLKNFLADADRRNITDNRVQEWVAELKRAMYEAADILDLCQLKAMEQGLSTKDVGCFNPLLFCMRNPSHAHDIGTRIKALNKRLSIIKERSAAFSFIPLGSYEDRSSKLDLDQVLDLEMIANLPRLQKLTIKYCQKMKAVEGVPLLQRLFLSDNNMETIPEYMGGINPRQLELYCSPALLASIAVGKSGPEWDKFSHVEHVKTYASQGDNSRKWNLNFF
ncbi:hypothetical protein TRIUR3_13216 [Triticum urartu]|uniref:Disease resistance N-terminal domain-containing protein n=1 Tax=Triticum urartu TaxID=4572 RepID=M7ZJM6_TRIUA|nr:hypothetical protein TRIUR3_13216 [Triticum urartu]